MQLSLAFPAPKIRAYEYTRSDWVPRGLGGKWAMPFFLADRDGTSASVKPLPVLFNLFVIRAPHGLPLALNHLLAKDAIITSSDATQKWAQPIIRRRLFTGRRDGSPWSVCH